MNAKLLIAGISLTILAGCSKDKFSSKPQLTFKSINTLVVPPDGVLSFTLGFTDKEGDIQNNIYVEKIARNCELSHSVENYPIPTDVPKDNNLEGELVINFAYGLDAQNATKYPLLAEPQCGSTSNPINDTCVYRFVLTDVANNSSDTLVSPEFVILKRH